MSAATARGSNLRVGTDSAQSSAQDAQSQERELNQPDSTLESEASNDFETDSPAAPGFDANVSDDERRRMIAEAAYYIAQRRGFDDGLELEDWLAAEAEVNARLASL